jgi:hypothetical protein
MHIHVHKAAAILHVQFRLLDEYRKDAGELMPRSGSLGGQRHSCACEMDVASWQDSKVVVVAPVAAEQLLQWWGR